MSAALGHGKDVFEDESCHCPTSA